MEEIQGAGSTPNEIPGGENTEKDTVSYESHAKLLKQLKRQKEQMDDVESLKSRLSAMEEEKRLQEEAIHQKKGNYQAIIEARDSELKKQADLINQLSAEKNEATQTLTDSYKLNAFLNKLPGNITNDQYLSFVDLESIGFVDGRVDNETVDQVVSSFVANHGGLITPKKMAKLPAGDAVKSGVSKPLTGRDAVKGALMDVLKNEL